MSFNGSQGGTSVQPVNPLAPMQTPVNGVNNPGAISGNGNGNMGAGAGNANAIGASPASQTSAESGISTPGANNAATSSAAVTCPVTLPNPYPQTSTRDLPVTDVLNKHNQCKNGKPASANTSVSEPLCRLMADLDGQVALLGQFSIRGCIVLSEGSANGTPLKMLCTNDHGIPPGPNNFPFPRDLLATATVVRLDTSSAGSTPTNLMTFSPAGNTVVECAPSLCGKFSLGGTALTTQELPLTSAQDKPEGATAFLHGCLVNIKTKAEACSWLTLAPPRTTNGPITRAGVTSSVHCGSAASEIIKTATALSVGSVGSGNPSSSATGNGSSSDNTTANAANSTSTNGKLGGLAIFGIVAAALAVIFGFALGGFVLRKRRRAGGNSNRKSARALLGTAGDDADPFASRRTSSAGLMYGAQSTPPALAPVQAYAPQQQQPHDYQQYQASGSPDRGAALHIPVPNSGASMSYPSPTAPSYGELAAPPIAAAAVAAASSSTILRVPTVPRKQLDLSGYTTYSVADLAKRKPRGPVAAVAEGEAGTGASLERPSSVAQLGDLMSEDSLQSVVDAYESLFNAYEGHARRMASGSLARNYSVRSAAPGGALGNPRRDRAERMAGDLAGVLKAMQAAVSSSGLATASRTAPTSTSGGAAIPRDLVEMAGDVFARMRRFIPHGVLVVAPARAALHETTMHVYCESEEAGSANSTVVATVWPGWMSPADGRVLCKTRVMVE
ncbi:hypothetical protein H9P43_008508 [Blastocladiella emersonii ATCC 22665]|nr:hypothetical protein H9P43_008508 [Blastocladiella emersonii ATCC 22665]